MSYNPIKFFAMQIKKCLFIILSFSVTAVLAQSVDANVKKGFDKIKVTDFTGAERDFSSLIKQNETKVDIYLDQMKKYAAMTAFERATSPMPDGFVYNHEYAIP